MKLLIVESPNKCATLKKILGADWQVEASVGHITELASDGDDNLGFDLQPPAAVDCRFVPRGDRGADVIRKLKAAAAKAEAIYLATDPDREGESISWHLIEQICGKKPYHRVTYTQITEAAVKAAIANARTLDHALCDAQRARQCLDKLVGYKCSSLVRQAGGGKSAGRVQSAALHILCDLERKITNFKPEPYWSLVAQYAEGFSATYAGSEAGAVQAQDGGDEDAAIDESADPAETAGTESKRVTTQAEADRIVKIAKSSPHQVIEFSARQAQKAPPPPLTTSGLQQAAGVKYGLSSDRTMKLAQELFEGMKLPDGSTHGAITYHRTDSTSLAPEFCDEVRSWLSANHPALVPAKAKQFKDKEGAQAAHEAIRPVDVANTPAAMKSCLNDEQHKVYTLIWQRAIASQCASAQFDRTRVVIQAGTTFWSASGAILTAAGFTQILGSLEGDTVLPALAKGQAVTAKEVRSEAKKTTPPGRLSEPRLVQTLERLGIGRPSTFANIIKTLKDREYIAIKGKSMVPTKEGMHTDEVLQKVFPTLIDSRFTAKMETDLDLIAEGKKAWDKYLCDFYFNFLKPQLEGQGAKLIAASQVRSDKPCGSCGEMLLQQPFAPKFKTEKNYFLKCGKRCEGEVYFWNGSVKEWVKKGTQVERSSVPRPAGVPTQFVCQYCGSPLEEVSYTKDGEAKKMLRCSDPEAWKDETHKAIGVYFVSKKGGYWNPTLQAEPMTEKSTGGAKPAAKSGGAKAMGSRAKGKGKRSTAA